MTDRELMQQALEKLEFFAHMKSVSEDTMRLITALRERLAHPEQEQVKFKCTVVDDDHPNGIPIEQWSIPSIRKPLVGLTEQSSTSRDYLELTWLTVSLCGKQLLGLGL